MPNPSTPTPTSQRLLFLPGLRVVIFVLAGSLLAAGIAAFFGHPYFAINAAEGSGGETNLEGPLLGVLVLMIPLEWVAFYAVRKGMRKTLAEALEALSESPYQPGAPLPQSFVTISIIGAAMTSGIGFFAAVIHLLTGSIVALAVAGAAGLFILYQVPSDDSLRGI